MRDGIPFTLEVVPSREEPDPGTSSLARLLLTETVAHSLYGSHCDMAGGTCILLYKGTARVLRVC